MSATRRASPASSFEQHPREPVRSVPGAADSARCTPTTSWPASTMRAAATDESTPPLIATSTLITRPPPRWPARPAARGPPPRAAPRSAASTSASTLVWPNESRSDPRALAGSAPIAMQHMRRLRDTGRARRTGRALDSLGVQQHQQRIALAAAEGEVRVAGQPSRARGAVEHDVVDARPARRRPAGRAAPQPGTVGLQPVDRDLRRPRPSPTAPATSGVPERTSRSCPPPCRQRHAGGVAAQQQRADTGRAAELVRRHAHRRQPAGREVDRYLADRLDRVAVHRNVEFGCDRGQFGDRHDGADLVVGPHHRHQRDVVVAPAGRRAARRRDTDPSARSAARSPRRLRVRRAIRPSRAPRGVRPRW